MNKIKIKSIQNTLKNEEGHQTNSWKDTTELLLRKLFPDDKQEEDNEQNKTTRINAKVQPTNNQNKQEELEINNELIDNFIKSLKNGKAPGPDNLKNEIYKNNKEIWTPYLTRLFQECLQQGIFPDPWKKARLVILLKGEDKDRSDPKSYRPICLLNIIGKIFEKVIAQKINEKRPNIENCKLQYGFRKKKSTEDAVNEICDKINELKTQDCRYVMGIFFDITGAFDNLWWPALLQELKLLNLHPRLWDTINNYFINRRVEAGTADGIVGKVPTRGCPQGSVLDPIFWDIAFQPCLVMLDGMQEVEARGGLR